MNFHTSRKAGTLSLSGDGLLASDNLDVAGRRHWSVVLMALICPNCKARNRSIAKFCIECITSLPTGCPDTDFAPTVRAAPETSYLNRPRAPGGLRSKPTTLAPNETAAKEAAPASKGLWISIAGLIASLVIGSAGWLVAGAGGWYLYAAGSAQVDPPRPGGAPKEVAGAKNAHENPEVAALAAPSSGNVLSQVAPVPGPSRPINSLSEADRPAHAPAAAVVRSPVPVPTTGPGPQLGVSADTATTSAPAVAEAPRPKALASANPMAACSPMNFIAAAQCMASQCLKPGFKSHPQCEAVRRRQQLEEQKRNPIAP